MNSNIEIISTPQKVDMADDWYQYATADNFWIQGRYNAVIHHLSMQSLFNAKLFEIGCGNGINIQLFEKLQNITVDGCDLNMFALTKIQNIKGKLFYLNIFEKPKALLNQYDGILLMDVIEHIDNDSEFLKTSLHYLKCNGLVVINVPAINFLYSKYDLVDGHKRRYSKKMVENLFVQNEIEKVCITYWGFSLLLIALMRKLFLKFTPENKVMQRGFKPPNKIINQLLEKMLRLEGRFVKSPILGTSIVAIGRIKCNDQKT